MTKTNNALMTSMAILITTILMTTISTAQFASAQTAEDNTVTGGIQTDIAVPADGTWNLFMFGGPGSSVGPFEFDCTLFGGCWISVADCCLTGDQFEIIVDGTSLGLTSFVPTGGPSCGVLPDPCFASPSMSSGMFLVADGSHSMTIVATLSPFGSGDGWFKIDQHEDPVLKALDEIQRELKEIWDAIQNQVIPLLTNIDRTTTDTNNEITNEEWGLQEIKREVRIIEKVVTSHTDKVSVTVNLDDKLKTGQVMVLLDTTGTGTLSTVHVAASLPCNITGDGKPTAGSGNDAPGVYVVVGVATGTLSNLIWDASTDTGFEGSDNTCVYHASVNAGDVTGGVITDVIIIHPDNHPDADIKKHEKLKGIVTVTGTYN